MYFNYSLAMDKLLLFGVAYQYGMSGLEVE